MDGRQAVRPRRRIAEADLIGEGWFESDVKLVGRDLVEDVQLRLVPGWIHVATLAGGDVYAIGTYPSQLVEWIGSDPLGGGE